MERSLDNYQIKILAALFMVIDHVGAIFFPNLEILRFIGRFSFPLFGWLLVQGEAHTRNVWLYLFRLVLLGVISQPLYLLNFQGVADYNILFSLAIGLLCLRATRMQPIVAVFAWVVGVVLAQKLNVDYGGYGIAMIALIGQFKPTGLWWTSWLLLHVITLAISPNLGISQAPVLCAPIFFLIATQERGKRAKWFYLFYPGHLLILLLLQFLVGMRSSL